MKTIAERLKEAREALGLSQEQLAKAAGVTQSTIGNIEAGLRKNPRELLAIAAAAEVNPEWLKSGRGERSPQLQIKLSVAEPSAKYNAAPAPPPAGFADRRQVSESDWALLQDIKTVFSVEDLKSIRERARAAQERAMALIEERKGKT